jgi:hypothetical protein
MEESMTINFSKLEKLSKKINEASDELTKALTSINEKLNSLNLGIEVFLDKYCLVTDYGDIDYSKAEEGVRTDTYYYLGYGKSDDGKWGLMIKAEDWLVCMANDEDNRFYDQSITPLLSYRRDLRIAAIDKMVPLIEALEKKSEAFTESVNAAKKLADEL